MGKNLRGESIASFVRALSEIGPNFSEISRRINIPKETVRYWYYKKILAHGFGIYAFVDIGKLGLKRVITILDFAKEYKQYTQAILVAMNQLCYLTYFERIMPDDTYLVHASVPENYVQQYFSVLEHLKDVGLFSHLESYVYDLFWTAPMKAEYYDFDTGRWFYDWKTSGALQLPSVSEMEDFDRIDLLILKELQKDASRDLSLIAKELSINYRTLNWHYTKHVVRRKLLKSYFLRWMGTRYDYKAEKALQRAHRYFNVVLFMNNTIGTSLLSKINELPFIWSQALGESGYYCEFFFPVDVINECFQYLTTILSSAKQQARILIMDQTNALTFSVPFHLYDEESHAWRFDTKEVSKSFEGLLLNIRYTEPPGDKKS